MQKLNLHNAADLVTLCDAEEDHFLRSRFRADSHKQDCLNHAFFPGPSRVSGIAPVQAARDNCYRFDPTNLNAVT
jgi:hypothetical protein